MITFGIKYRSWNTPIKIVLCTVCKSSKAGVLSLSSR